jgi:hypothetical protein
MCQSLKDILVDKDNQWQPLVDKKGKAIDGQPFLSTKGCHWLSLATRISLRD